MNSIIVDILMVSHLIFIISTFIGSFYYGSYMISKTGLFIVHSLIAVFISLVLGIFALMGWVLFTWGTNEYLLFGGLSFGAGLIVVGVIGLFISLCVKRKQFLNIYFSDH